MHTRCWNLFSSSRTFRLHIAFRIERAVQARVFVCACGLHTHRCCSGCRHGSLSSPSAHFVGMHVRLYWGCSLVSRLFRLQIMQASINVGLHSHVHGIVRYACAAFLRVPCTRMIAMCLMGAPVTGSMHIFIPGVTMVSRLFRSQNMHTAIKV